MSFIKKIFKNIMISNSIEPSTNEMSIDQLDAIPRPEYKCLDQYKFEQGRFGKVMAVELNNTGDKFALKKMWLSDSNSLDEAFKEISILSRLTGKWVVKFISAWKEEEFIFILMELCDDNLKNVLAHKPQAFAKEIGHQICMTEFFVSWHMWQEMLRGVHYLHTLNPPVIHRDLKPANILISDGKSGNFIKLCDFGMAIVHNNSSHTEGAGSRKYMAPEVKNGRKYNEKSDVYSLVVMAVELFGFDISDKKNEKHWLNWTKSNPANQYSQTDLAQNFEHLIESLASAFNQEDYHNRPSCGQLLEQLEDCSIDKNMLVNNNKFKVKRAKL